MERDEPLIDEVMPSYDRRELHRHQTPASAAAVWKAIHDLSGNELRLMRLLMAMRSLGRRPDGSDRTVLEGFRRMGFQPVAERPGQELVIAGIGRFWELSGGLRRVEGPEHFTRFDEPGYAKVAFNFLLADGQLSTETRITGTDAFARRRFGLYWLLVRPGSGLIRHEWLRAIDRRAQLHLRRANEFPHRAEGEGVLLEHVPRQARRVLDLAANSASTTSTATGSAWRWRS